MGKRLGRLLAACVVLSMLAAACSSDDGGGGGGADETTAATVAAAFDYAAIGLWDDGPCDEAKPPLSIGLMTVFESPVVSLGDQATALEASAEAFNARGGANGACIEVHTCDDGANLDQARRLRARDRRGRRRRHRERPGHRRARRRCRRRWPTAGIPRVARERDARRLGRSERLPARCRRGRAAPSCTPQALIEAGVTEIGCIRVDLAAGRPR